MIGNDFLEKMGLIDPAYVEAAMLGFISEKIHGSIIWALPPVLQ